MKTSCYLCGSEKVQVVETIDTNFLKKFYKKYLGDLITTEFDGLDILTAYNCSNCDITFFKPFTTGTENFYRCLQDNQWYYQDTKNEYKTVSSLIKDGTSVLEIGCGKGVFGKMIPNTSYTGLEYNDRSVERAREQGLSVLKESIEDHSAINEGKYDVVCSFQVLEHVENPVSFIESSVRCLKPGGIMIITVPSFDSFLANVYNNLLDLPPHHLSKWTYKSLESVADVFNLKLSEIIKVPLDDIHKRLYSNARVYGYLNKLFCRRIRFLDNRFLSRLLNFFSYILGYFYSLFLNIKQKPGLAVTGVYVKESN